MKIAFFDTKSYWVDAFKPMAEKYGYEITFFNERLTPATAHLAAGHDATCSFVNDEVPAEVVRELNATCPMQEQQNSTLISQA